jgi:hypothetical protein
MAAQPSGTGVCGCKGETLKGFSEGAMVKIAARMLGNNA